jgi:hypothetical protein
MITKKRWDVINISLGLIALLLIITFIGVELPSLGKSTAELKEQSVCVLRNWQGDYIERDVDNCCLEKNKFTTTCYNELFAFAGIELTKNCPAGEKIQYHFNQEAYKYCLEMFS